MRKLLVGECAPKVAPREEPYRFCPNCKTGLARKSIDGRKLLSCAKCGFVFWNNPVPAVSVVIEKDGKILLLKRAKSPLKNYWRLPGGYVNCEEKPEEAIARETMEETSLEVKVTGLLGVYRIDNDPRGINLDIIYAGSITGGELKINGESSEFGFFSANELPELIAYKHREAIQAWKKKIAQSSP